MRTAVFPKACSKNGRNSSRFSPCNTYITSYCDTEVSGELQNSLSFATVSGTNTTDCIDNLKNEEKSSEVFPEDVLAATQSGEMNASEFFFPSIARATFPQSFPNNESNKLANPNHLSNFTTNNSLENDYEINSDILDFFKGKASDSQDNIDLNSFSKQNDDYSCSDNESSLLDTYNRNFQSFGELSQSVNSDARSVYQNSFSINQNHVGADEEFFPNDNLAPDDEFDENIITNYFTKKSLLDQKTSIWSDLAMSNNVFDQYNKQNRRISLSQPSGSVSMKHYFSEDYDVLLNSNSDISCDLKNISVPSHPYWSSFYAKPSVSAPLYPCNRGDDSVNVSVAETPPQLEISRIYNDYLGDYMNSQLMMRNSTDAVSSEMVNNQKSPVRSCMKSNSCNSLNCPSMYSQVSSSFENLYKPESTDEVEEKIKFGTVNHSPSDSDMKVPTLPLKSIVELPSLRMGTPRTPHTPTCMKQLSFASNSSIPNPDTLKVRDALNKSQIKTSNSKHNKSNSLKPYIGKSNLNFNSSDLWANEKAAKLNVLSNTTAATASSALTANKESSVSQNIYSNNVESYFEPCTTLKSMPVLPSKEDQSNSNFNQLASRFSSEQNLNLNYPNKYAYSSQCSSLGYISPAPNNGSPRNSNLYNNSNNSYKCSMNYMENSTCKNPKNFTKNVNEMGTNKFSNYDLENSVRLFVGKIPKWYTNRELKKVFDVFGHVLECNIIRDRRNTQLQRCGFVRLENLQTACQAIKQLNQIVSLDKDLGPVQVKFASGELDRLNLPLELQPGGECVKLFFGNITLETTKEELTKLFGVYGKYEELCILRDRNKRSKCSGFITFNRYKDAEAAIKGLNGQYCIMNATRPFEVRFAESKVQRGLKT